MGELDAQELKQIMLSLKNGETNEYLYWGRNDSFKLGETIFKAKTINVFKQNILNTILICLERKSISKYDLEVSADETIEIMDSDKVENYQIINKRISENDILPINQNTNLDKFNFICFKLELEIGEEKKIVTIIKKFNKPASVLKQSMKFKWIGEVMEEIQEDVIYLDNQVDAFDLDGKFYIINRNHFNTIFKFKDMYCKLIDKSIEDIKQIEFIDKPNEFAEKCKANGHYVKKLSKTIITKGFENIKKHKDRIPDLIKEHKLKIILDESGKVVYDEGNIEQILNLILDHFVKSSLTDKRAVAKALEFEEE